MIHEQSAPVMDFLTLPMDASRPHDVGLALSWHGRLMVLGWGVLAPMAVLAARFGKVWPGQKWPQTLDNPTWWRLHWITQTLVVAMAAGALALMIIAGAQPNAPLHRILGYAVLVLGGFQYLSGLLRGTKGGPTDTKLRGDHYDMTPRRVLFERLHKSLGYAALALTIGATFTGLWAANAPVWMPLTLTVFWAGLILAFVRLQKNNHAVDTYQAIWGPDPKHPGNQRDPIGWGITRPAPTGD